MKFLLVLFFAFSVAKSIAWKTSSVSNDKAKKPVSTFASGVIRDFDSIKQAVSLAFN